jgi:broad specificity phosphatase PhoE
MIRHGESVDDIEDCYGGIADFPLTPHGREQARDVGARLVPNAIEAVFSSPLARAHETAQIIVDALSGQLPLIIVDELQERNSYGVLSGVNKERAKVLFRSVFATLTEKPGYSREPLVGAEDFDLFVQRVNRAFNHVVTSAQDSGYSRIAVVTHGKFTQALFSEVLRLEGNVYLDLSTVNVVQYQPAAVSLVSK